MKIHVKKKKKNIFIKESKEKRHSDHNITVNNEIIIKLGNLGIKGLGINSSQGTKTGVLLSVKNSYQTCPRKVEPERTPKRQHISVQFSVFFYSNRFFLIFLLSEKLISNL